MARIEPFSTFRRSLRLTLVAAALAAAAVASVACSSGGGGGSTPTPTASPTPFNPVGCQIVWVTRNPPGQTAIIDYYVIDAPVGKWVTGTNGFYVGDPTGATNVTGAFVHLYNLTSQTSAAAAVASAGVFTVGTDPTDPTLIGNPVNLVDTTPQHYFLLDSAGQLTADEGSSGVGQFQGVWSDPGSPDVVQGSGTVQILFESSSYTLGTDLAYGLCYSQSSFAPPTTQERIAEAGRRAAALLQSR